MEFTWNEETIDYFAELYDLNGWAHVAQRVLSFVTHECDLEDGETTQDGKFTLESVHCLGACALAPIVTVNEKYYGNMSISKMMEVIEEQHESSDGAESAQTPAQEEVLV